jgi:hypothetical protein
VDRWWRREPEHQSSDGVTRHGSEGKKKGMFALRTEKECQVGTNAWPIA